jgi:hypothetical protein
LHTKAHGVGNGIAIKANGQIDPVANETSLWKRDRFQENRSRGQLRRLAYAGAGVLEDSHERENDSLEFRTRVTGYLR